MHPLDDLPLRRLVLAVAVLDEVDLEPSDAGVVLPGDPPVTVSWGEVRSAAGGTPWEGQVARSRLRRHLRTRRWVADAPAEELLLRCRPLGVPAAAGRHPGPDWICESVPGGVLDLGLGACGVPDRPIGHGRAASNGGPAGVVPVWPAWLSATTADLAACRTRAWSLLERMGVLAAERVRADPRRRLRPMGDCDVVTLLGSRLFRGALGAADGTGMCAVVVPHREYGWVHRSPLDPAFAVVAAAATDDAERAFPRPLLVTLDEVALAREGGRPAMLVLDEVVPAPLNST